MRPLDPTPDLLALAKATVWFKEPADALAYPEHFVAHVLTYGTYDDVKVLCRHLGDDDLRHRPASSTGDPGPIGT